MDDTTNNQDEITGEEGEEVEEGEEGEEVEEDEVVDEVEANDDVSDENELGDTTDSNTLQEVEEPQIQAKFVMGKSAKPSKVGGPGISPWQGNSNISNEE